MDLFECAICPFTGLCCICFDDLNHSNCKLWRVEYISSSNVLDGVGVAAGIWGWNTWTCTWSTGQWSSSLGPLILSQTNKTLKEYWTWRPRGLEWRNAWIWGCAGPSVSAISLPSRSNASSISLLSLLLSIKYSTSFPSLPPFSKSFDLYGPLIILWVNEHQIAPNTSAFEHVNVNLYMWHCSMLYGRKIIFKKLEIVLRPHRFCMCFEIWEQKRKMIQQEWAENTRYVVAEQVKFVILLLFLKQQPTYRLQEIILFIFWSMKNYLRLRPQ